MSKIRTNIALSWMQLIFGVGVAVAVTQVNDTTSNFMGVVFLVAGCLIPAVGVWYGQRTNQPADRRPWLIYLALMASAVIAAVVRTLVYRGSPVTTGDQIIYVGVLLPSYILFTWAIIRILRVREHGKIRPVESFTDSVIIAVAGLLFMWSVIIDPILLLSEETATAIALRGVLPVLSAVTLFFTARTAMTFNRTPPSLILLCAGVSTTVIAHAFNSADIVPDLFTRKTSFVAYLIGLSAVSAAALHPSMKSLTEPEQRETSRVGSIRFASMGVALLTPALSVILNPPVELYQQLVFATFVSILGLTVLWRMSNAVNAYATGEELLAHTLDHDVLTQLPNRRALQEMLTEEFCQKEPFALLLLDLDRFQKINDTHGHSVGDELIKATAGRISNAVRPEDFIARVGGDEFAIVLRSIPSSIEVVDAATRILSKFDSPVRFPDQQEKFHVTSSIGVAFSVDAEDSEDLIRNADMAMYEAKVCGRNNVVVFRSDMRFKASERLGLENDLREAVLTETGFVLFYQPILDLQTERPVAFEALIRWMHPQKGMISPLDFIPLSEETGLIVPLGQWVFREAIGQLSEWQKVYKSDLCMSVNLSARQLGDQDLLRVVRKALSDGGVDPSCLWVEITESIMIEDSDAAQQTINGFRDLGAHLAIDDFGTGYASLSSLQRQPVDHVKIDKSFVDELAVDADSEGVIVQAVIAMSHAMNVKVVAEGVEERHQADRLHGQNCEFVQGFFFSKPLQAEDASEFLAERQLPPVLLQN